VFREGAETVLFIHALAQMAGGWSTALFSGLVLGAAVLVILFLAMNVIARRLPLRPVFIATSAFLFIMTIKFIGDVIQEFQEHLLVSYTQAPEAPLLSAVGLNATLEALSAQVLVIMFAVATFAVLQWRARHAYPQPDTAARAD
jgi:high-affinity iron transporter